MASTFFLKNLPPHKIFEDLSRRYPDLDPSAVEPLLALLRVASDVLIRIDARMARRGMSQGKFSVMMQLNLDPEAALTPSELAGRIGVSRATITGLVSGLTRQGFVSRDLPGQDRRSHRLRLTAKGRAFLNEMLPGHYRRTGRLMAGLAKPERRALAGLLAKIGARLSELEGD